MSERRKSTGWPPTAKSLAHGCVLKYTETIPPSYAEKNVTQYQCDVCKQAGQWPAYSCEPHQFDLHLACAASAVSVDGITIEGMTKAQVLGVEADVEST
jgi:hypothetical protein